MSKEKLILQGEDPILVEKWAAYLALWPSKIKCQELALKSGYKDVRFYNPKTAITISPYQKDRLTIYYNDKNKIYKIIEG